MTKKIKRAIDSYMGGGCADEIRVQAVKVITDLYVSEANKTFDAGLTPYSNEVMAHLGMVLNYNEEEGLFYYVINCGDHGCFVVEINEFVNDEVEVIAEINNEMDPTMIEDLLNAISEDWEDQVNELKEKAI